MATADESKFWTTKSYILAALGGTLAATVVVIVVSVILSPADISFSIVHASNSNGSAVGSIQFQYLNLTIAAANTGRKRAAVRYEDVFVGLQNSTARRNTINTQVYERPPAGQYRPPGAGPAFIKASILLAGFGHYLDSVGNRGITVVVEARVRFRVAGIPTRLYNMKVFCPHLLLPVEGPPVNCGG